MQRTRRLPQPPDELGARDGLAYALYVPDEPPRGSIVIVHGAGSCKESHLDFARDARAAGFAAVAFDQRGHGASEGELGGRALDDIASVATLLPDAPVALRGSSMGGYFALLAAARIDARAVVAICPASSDHLRRLLRAGDYEFRADVAACDAFLEAHDLSDCVAELDAALLLMHAEGDERVPVEHSRALYAAARSPHKRLITIPGGHHRSVQHDSELQHASLRFIAKQLAPAPA